MADDTIYRLYKYRSLSNRHARGKKSPQFYTQRLVKNGMLYYGRPSSLNDPFECRWSISLNGAQVPEFAIGRNDEFVAHYERFMCEHSDDSFALFCLAKECDNLLMWSHYADCHTGICVELMFQAEERLHEVKYTDDCPKLYYADIDPRTRNVERYHNSVMSMLTTKAMDWRYEKECRCICLKENDVAPHGEKPMPRGSMTGIIFGHRTSEQDKMRVLHWVIESGEHPSFYQARMRSGHFALDIVPVKFTGKLRQRRRSGPTAGIEGRS